MTGCDKMYCSNCGRQIPDGSKFCSECGAPVFRKQNEPVREPEYAPPAATAGGRQKNAFWKPILICVAVLAVTLIAINFTGNSVPVIQELTREQKYENMVEAYHSGDYEACWDYCEELGDFQDTQKYGNLAKARLMNFSSEDEVVEHSKKLVAQLDFEDTGDVLVSNFFLAKGYLLGYWTSYNGMHTFEITKGNSYITTIPVPAETGDTYDIEDGVLYTYHKKTPDERIEELKITPVSAEKVKMYSYRVRKTYELTKRR